MRASLRPPLQVRLPKSERFKPRPMVGAFLLAVPFNELARGIGRRCVSLDHSPSRR
jgi:hypothetical protein